jgi:PGF-CTERM protein
LAAVARGEMETWEPQPYASLNIDPHLYNVKSGQQKYHVRAVSFDRAHNLLYIFEPFADNDKSLIHVWSVTITAPTTSPTPTPIPSLTSTPTPSSTPTPVLTLAPEEGVPGFEAIIAIVGLLVIAYLLDLLPIKCYLYAKAFNRI